MIRFSIPKPDDFHVHLRDDARTPLVLDHTEQHWGRVLAMPNTIPPIYTPDDAQNYKKRLKKHKDTPLLQIYNALYLTDKTTKEEIEEVSKSEAILSYKLYPKGATTNSAGGVAHILDLDTQLKALETFGVPLCVHGEVIDKGVDIFDRERVFYTEIAPKIIENYPNIKLVCEHITSKEAVAFLNSQKGNANVGATITPQHLLCNRHDMLAGGIKPHYYCLPILKREEDRQALLDLVKNNSGNVWAGTDSAPHCQSDKESACGCAGCYTAEHGVLLYAQVFDELFDLSKKESQIIFSHFMSSYGAAYYGLETQNEKIELVKSPYKVKKSYELPDGKSLIPFWAGKTLNWSYAS